MGRAKVLAALLLLWAFWVVGTKVVPPAPCKTQCPPRIGTDFEIEVVRLTNAERTSRGLQPLKINPKMMSDARNWSHVQAKSRMHHSRMGYGENVAYGQDTPQEVMQAWMNSRGHRANILNGRYSTIGVGAVNSGRAIFWTQVFE